MKFSKPLFLLLATYVNAQDDNPTGHEVGQVNPLPPQSPPLVPGTVDDNPSPSDILEGKNATVSATPSVVPQVDDSTLKSDAIGNKVVSIMWVLGMMLML